MELSDFRDIARTISLFLMGFYYLIQGWRVYKGKKHIFIGDQVSLLGLRILSGEQAVVRKREELTRPEILKRKGFDVFLFGLIFTLIALLDISVRVYFAFKRGT